MSRGHGKVAPPWWLLVERCQWCTREVGLSEGIFCANFGFRQNASPICQGAWCASCYADRPGSDFFVYRPTDEDGNELEVEGDKKRFLTARSGDHIICPFECDDCVFFCLKGKWPVEGKLTEGDLVLQRLIRRANLDAFWSREPSTVSGQLRDVKRQLKLGEQIGIQMFDALGLLPGDYDSGIRAAIALLHNTTLPGKHEDKMKFSAARRARSTHTNVYMASLKGMSAVIMRADKHCQVLSGNPTDSEWFSRFISGCQARIGERVKQDLAVSIPVMLAIQAQLEIQWELAAPEDRRSVAELGTFFLVTFCASLRGYETMKILLTSMQKGMVDSTRAVEMSVQPHMAVPLQGRFKARSNQVQRLMLFVAPETRSGLQPLLWARRLINEMALQNITSGWLFQDEQGVQQKMGAYSDGFFGVLQDVQEANPSIMPDINVTEDYGMARSLRRGATTQATKKGVSASDIDWVN